MHLRFERRMLPNVPWGVVASALVIALLGIWNLTSAARPPQSPVWKSQAIYLALGVAVMAVVGVMDYRFIQRMAVPLYAVNLFLLVALRFVGHRAKGAESWLVLGPLRIQPAEFVKLGIILMLAKFFHEHPKRDHESYGVSDYWQPLLIIFVPLVLVLVQPDLGTALMIFFTGLTVLLFSRPRRWIWVSMAVGAVAVSGVLWNDYVRDTPGHATVIRHHLKRHQDRRISGWLDPESDTRGSNYHAAQSRIAVGSGGISGKGWKRGTQAYLRFL
ncbi:MAG TPA: FtsW/RodA/SpoVE family cell cycle protein, partial [Myxococcaceae bacterium]|nr:FtsW/RodA/SpoVE family cell cycle protein [Myxococcaceae bacterium]